MLNRIRRGLTAVRPPTASTFSASTDAMTVTLNRASTDEDHRHSLATDDVALVRPYLLAWEKRVRTRPVVVAPHLPIHAWPALAGIH
ncbi:hypothetical protein [Streptomyces sp. NBC_00151]|uniref:hypothetical protein n=1 Tax=Streptomyces sp. NBC_00151 TaxID=2975669 RepID=UPI002DDB53ED|nr:hypothetical protein [Streptomyces sp. NBC_00151]WRZ39135.1 hypothetical protein OG915_14445 [Streptomyces sp. NBC_00151]